MNPKLLGSLLVGIIVLSGVYIGTLSLDQEQVTQSIVTDQVAQVSSALPTGLIAHLPFDDSSLSDVSGNNNNGSWTGNSSFSAGKIGNGSASFGGSNYVSINKQVYPISGGTVSLWFKSYGGTLTGSYGGSGNQRAPTLSVSSDGKFNWQYSEYSDTGGQTGISVNDGNWHHAALTYTSSNQVKVYLDGSLVATDTVPSPGDFFDQVHIGHYGNFGSIFGNGQVDDFRIYNKALSASDISKIYSYTGVVADTTAPSISNVNASNIQQTESTITWMTNEASDSYVEYGVSTSYGSNTFLDAGKVTSHSQGLSGLIPNTVYNYRVTSKDAAGNSASSANQTFKTLAPPNVSPTVSLTAPSSATAPASITLSASASDSDGTISKVDFYSGSSLIGSDASSPYSYSWSNIAAGTYSLTAKATDDDGAVTTSNNVSLTVASAPVGCAAGTVLSGTTCIPASTAFSVGVRVQTYNANTVNVRQVPEGTVLGTQPSGVIGTVVGGPSYAGNLWWWKINYDSGVGGWSVENFLKLSTVTNPPTPTTFTVTTAKSGTGSGTVSCSPSTCTANTGSTVTVTAVAASGSTFTGWSGACSGTGACTLTSAATVTANFTAVVVTPTTFTITTAKVGTGSGTVTCNPTSCSANAGSTVTVSAVAASGSTFAGWSGACSGTGSCAVTSAGTVAATFNTVPATGGQTINLTPTTWNAMSGSSFVRGNTYILAPGTYAGKTLSTPVDGTKVITIKGSGAGQVVFTPSSQTAENVTTNAAITFKTSYWIFDGVTGHLSKNPADYGFMISTPSGRVRLFQIYDTTSTVSDITISHVAATAPSGDVEKFFVGTNDYSKSVNNITISHNYINGFQNAYWATSNGLTMNNWVFEYNIALNLYSSAAYHGGWINNNYGKATNQIVR